MTVPKSIHQFAIRILALFILAASPGAFAERLIDKSEMRPTINVVESGGVSVVTNSAGEVVQVVTGVCEGCERRSFLPERNVRVMFEGQQLSAAGSDSMNGAPAFVGVRVNSGMATSVEFRKVVKERQNAN
ncbi:hypothetical protein [Marinobacter goseongensis]|uniref:hypothetical protein n=1 Tax=Marinobacter goseongensis TaxID=453838 RepID=UPI0020059211|nr:hypothetical protein [Marinobacter goseongensis]MCK7552068.1 hypothetical protein [Marinobacter goseongensis]